MARLSHDDSSSDVEFPARQVVAKRTRQQKPATAPTKLNIADKENAPPEENGSKNRRQHKQVDSAFASKGTPLRRRKLGDSQVLDNPLFRKWSEESTESRSRSARSSRVSSRGITQMIPEVSRTVPRDLEDSAEESDDDVFVRKRKPINPKNQKPGREQAENRVKTEVLVSITQLDDDVRTIEETLEISATISEGQTGSDDESEFVTALSEGEASESNYESPSELDFLPKARSSKSPGDLRQRSVQLPPPRDPPQKHMEKEKTSAKQKDNNDNTNHERKTSKTPPITKPQRSLSRSEDAANTLKLYAHDPDGSPKTRPWAQLDPVTPRKTLQTSRMEGPQIPPSPWKVDHKEFWDVEIQNEWIDRHSPPKRSTEKLDWMAGSDNKEARKKKYGTSPEKRGMKKAFDQVKEKIAQDFLEELDEHVTSGQLARLTMGTGGLRIKWSTALQTTAGRAHWKCKETITKVQEPDGSYKPASERKHEAWIELAAKVLNKEDDLMNTVAHEFCHLAVFMLNGKPKFAHGAEFKSWGQKCMDRFSARGIEVTTKHNYEIDFKFIWRCADCTCEVKRHSKSVDPAKQQCGRCRGTLEQVKPVPRAGAKGRTAYQEFVGNEMKALKAEGNVLKFKEMMAIVSTRWRAHQEANGKSKTADKSLRGLEEQLGGLVVTDLVSD